LKPFEIKIKFWKPVCKSFQNPSLVLPTRMLQEKEKKKQFPEEEKKGPRRKAAHAQPLWSISPFLHYY
jgi:hypothetical protein